ncbi:MAG TPA: hypothetical protein PK711_06355 [Bacteroidales bacterium]|nr:hypothetical protein [Bacteroidales bacterium]HRZ20382.1 hypothetical protein [Bacteroidales bacterium]
MNRQQFEHFLQFPGELSSRDTADLMELIRSFPYCQTLYLMLARAHSGDDSPYFQEHLRMAAARAIDRKRLKQLILDYPRESSPSNLPEESSVNEPTVAEEQQPDLDYFHQLIVELEQTFVALQQQKAKGRGSYDIEKEFPETAASPAAGLPAAAGEDEMSKERPASGTPHPPPPKSPFFDPVDIARKSVMEHNDIATETLARIYAEQGHFQRAIKIYQQLMLKFPEKSRYFAAQIKNLENKAGI